MTPRDDLVIELPDERQLMERHNAALEKQIEQLKAEQSNLSTEQEPEKTRHAELSKQIATLCK